MNPRTVIHYSEETNLFQLRAYRDVPAGELSGYKETYQIIWEWKPETRGDEHSGKGWNTFCNSIEGAECAWEASANWPHR